MTSPVMFLGQSELQGPPRFEGSWWQEPAEYHGSAPPATASPCTQRGCLVTVCPPRINIPFLSLVPPCCHF